MKPSFHLTPASSFTSLCSSSAKLWCLVLDVTLSPSRGKHLQLPTWCRTDPLQMWAPGSCSGSVCIALHTLQPGEPCQVAQMGLLWANVLEAHKLAELLLSRGQAGPALGAVSLLTLCPPLSEQALRLPGAWIKTALCTPSVNPPPSQLQGGSRIGKIFVGTQKAFHQFHAPECCRQASTWQQEEEAPWAPQVSSQHPDPSSILPHPLSDRLL